MRTAYPAQKANAESQDYIEGPQGLRREAQAELAEPVSRWHLHIDYYASLNSPWTHLGAARIEAMAAKHGASIRIWPVDFSAIFPASGGLPLPKRAPQRQAYRLMELRRWRERLGEPIHIQPKHFPANELPAACCVIAVRETIGDAPAIKLAHRVLRALWQEEQDTGDPATLAALIRDVGLDADAVTRLGADPQWLARRKRGHRGRPRPRRVRGAELRDR